MTGPVVACDDEAGEPVMASPRWTDWLRPQDVLLDVEAQDRKGALETAAACVGRAQRLEPEPILRASLCAASSVSQVGAVFSEWRPSA